MFKGEWEVLNLKIKNSWTRRTVDVSVFFFSEEEVSFDSVRERFWYVWFDDVYPPTPAVPEIKCKWRGTMKPRQ